MKDLELLQSELQLSHQDLALLLGTSRSLVSKSITGTRSLGSLPDGFLSQALRVLLTLEPTVQEESPAVNSEFIKTELKKLSLELDKRKEALLVMEKKWKAGIKKQAWVQKMRSEPKWTRTNIEAILNRFERDAMQLIDSNGLDTQQQLQFSIELLELKFNFWKEKLL